jgi:protein-tyrosine-phosphatase/DNA-binding HxlR family transcriptional regulator
MSVERRAAIHAALGEPARLAVVDALVLGDASPGELGEALGLPSNLLAHHLRVLQEAGVIRRSRSEADRRRSYVRLVPDALAMLSVAGSGGGVGGSRVVFVCTRNSARSQLAAALWGRRSQIPVASAGTKPGPGVHRRAIAAARRHGLVLDQRGTRHVAEVVRPGDLVVAVCDNAYEELGRRPALHWSVPDPVRVDTDEAFEDAFAEIWSRVDRLTLALDAGPPTPAAPTPPWGPAQLKSPTPDSSLPGALG